MNRVLSAVAAGTLSIEQGKSVSDILETQRGAIETSEIGSPGAGEGQDLLSSVHRRFQAQWS
jgi:hypothetical protein